MSQHREPRGDPALTGPLDLTRYDAQIIGNQERRIAHWKHEAELHEEQYNDLWNTVAELFNPPDSDSWHPLHSIEAAVKLIETQPCACAPTAAAPEYLEDPCERCQTLGRIHDRLVER